MKKIIAILLMLVPSAAAQQPQTQTAPIYAVNAKYVQGVGIGYWPTAGTGLVLNVAAGTANCNGTIAAYAGGTLTMTVSTTNYVYLNTSAACVPDVKSTAFAASDIPIATVVTGASAITTITDDRTMFQQNGGTGVTSFNGRTGAVSSASGDYTASMVGLGNVTNDAQTKASVVPNTAPSAGQILVGNAGGTAYAPVTMSGDGTIASTGSMNITATSNSTLTSLANLVTVGTITTGVWHGTAIANTYLANSATTVNGQTCTLGSTCTITAAATGIAVGTTTVSSGTSGYVLYDNGGVLGNLPVTGSGNVMLSASPTTTGTLNGESASFSGDVQVTGEFKAVTGGITSIFYSDPTNIRAVINTSGNELLIGPTSAVTTPISIHITHYDGTNWNDSIIGYTDQSNNLQIQSAGGTVDFVSSAINGSSISMSGAIHGGGGSGTAFIIGDDAALVDINSANTFAIEGNEDATKGYIKFGSSGPVMGANNSTTLVLTGSITTSGSDVSIFTNTTSNPIVDPAYFLAPNATAQIRIFVGANLSDYNSAIIELSSYSSGSTSNCLGLGFYGHENLFNLFGTGDVTIGTTTDSGYKLQVSGTAHITGSISNANGVILPSTVTGYTGDASGKVVLSTGTGYSGSCASTTTLTVVNGIITACS